MALEHEPTAPRGSSGHLFFCELIGGSDKIRKISFDRIVAKWTVRPHMYGYQQIMCRSAAVLQTAGSPESFRSRPDASALYRPNLHRYHFPDRPASGRR